MLTVYVNSVDVVKVQRLASARQQLHHVSHKEIG